LIEVENLSKSFNGNLAIDGVSFNVEQGEILGFLGPNGVGKTTTMRIITGYMPSSGGTVRVDGYDVFEQSMEVRKRIGYLPESPPLYPEMTVRSYLRFVAKIKGVGADRRESAIADVIGKCHLDEVTHRIVGRLSKGFKQRVGLAQSLLNDPKVLILDEPTIGLDPKQINDVRKLIKGLAGSHTVILSTHILPEVSMTCNRVVIIDKGKIVAVDTPENLTSKLRGAEQIHVEVAGPSGQILALLRGLRGVGKVELVEEGRETCRLLVESELSSDIRRDLAAAIVQGGYGLLELRAVTMSLEEVFIKLVTSEEHPATAA
jgi:ABC-2 type transport system ATP-binding protein